jgi:hypothetical protein
LNAAIVTPRNGGLRYAGSADWLQADDGSAAAAPASAMKSRLRIRVSGCDQCKSR